jgi:hypothetical protein
VKRRIGYKTRVIHKSFEKARREKAIMRRVLLASVSALAMVTAAVTGTTDARAAGDKPSDGDQLRRLATVPLGAEITGIFLTEEGHLFFNAQHPADSNAAPFNRATVGGIVGYDMNALPRTFTEMPVPIGDDEKQSVQTAVGDYQVIAQEGGFEEQIVAGLGGITDTSGTNTIKVSNDPDFNGFVRIAKDEGYLFTNWEDRPGGMSRMHIRMNDQGRWKIVDNRVQMIDFSSVNGTWVNCFGTVSPWNTPLTSEELYFDNTDQWNNPDYATDWNRPEPMTEYRDAYPNPYDYGYIVEITDPKGTPTPKKHYAMGRFSHENSVVMPDNKTVYLSDDGTGTVFFKFVADTAGDLSSGMLYAAKATQAANDIPAETPFKIDWIELAHGSNDEIHGWIRDYDGIDTEDYVEGESSYISDADVEAWANGEAEDDRAAFLESRKAAAAKGATAEFRKMEGVNIHYGAALDGSVPFMYMAMSSVGKTMADDKGDIRLQANPCGIVYRMKLDADYNVTHMVPAIAGGPYDGERAVNQCATESISNPDNLVVMKDGRVIVGEDTGEHENNALWIYDPEA